MTIQLPDHSTADLAGPGQPIHGSAVESQYWASFVADAKNYIKNQTPPLALADQQAIYDAFQDPYKSLLLSPTQAAAFQNIKLQATAKVIADNNLPSDWGVYTYDYLLAGATLVSQSGFSSADQATIFAALSSASVRASLTPDRPDLEAAVASIQAQAKQTVITANGLAANWSPYVEENGQSVLIVNGQVAATDSSSLHPGGYLQGLILDRVYRLLTKMIDSLQNVAVAQADRLQIYTDWQNAYNAKKSSIHAFVSSNGDAYISNGDDGNSTTRQDLNNINTNFTELMRSNSSIISDDAKALQTVINQTQDAVNKASNMATSLVQQFTTILSSIYR